MEHLRLKQSGPNLTGDILLFIVILLYFDSMGFKWYLKDIHLTYIFSQEINTQYIYPWYEFENS